MALGAINSRNAGAATGQMPGGLQHLAQALAAQIQQKVASGELKPEAAQKLMQDVQQLQQATTPAARHAAMEQLKKDAKAAGLKLPHHNGPHDHRHGNRPHQAKNPYNITRDTFSRG
jgi:hypothetical protein